MSIPDSGGPPLIPARPRSRRPRRPSRFGRSRCGGGPSGHPVRKQILVALCLAYALHIIPPTLIGSAYASVHDFESEEFGDEDYHDLPPIIDPSDIAFFASTYDIDGLHWALSSVFARSERMVSSGGGGAARNPLPETVVARGGGSSYTTEYKLRCDLEQAYYLVNEVFSDDPEHAELKSYFQKKVIPTLESVLERIPPLDELGRTGGLYAFRKQDIADGIGETYNKALYVPDHDEEWLLSSGGGGGNAADNGGMRRLLNEDLDLEGLQKEWMDRVDRDEPGIVVIDDLLSDEALRRVRNVLLDSTVWYQTKMPEKFGGYVGAYIDDGLHNRILLALAFELHKSLPSIMTGHDLKYLWAYKYDPKYGGINTHADQAAVNVNIWLTPDDANLDPKSGGLVVFTAKPPPGWDFEAYNGDAERVDRDILRPTGYANVTVPYRSNRAVIFDSALFHHTDRFEFRGGYRNRRINLTILYGEMNLGGPTCKDGGDDEQQD